jgi:hypothetical protein
VVIALQVVGIVAAGMAVAGALARVTLPVAWSCGLVLNAMTTSVGKVVHNDVLTLIALIPLLPAPTSGAWSVDSLLRRRRGGAGATAPPRSIGYGWPVRTAMVAVALAYFFIGLNKVVYSGPVWVTGDNLRFVLYAASDAHNAPDAAALFVADHPLVAHVVAATALLIELTFPLVLFRPVLRWLYVPGAVALHAGILLTLHLDYWPWAATVVVLFVDWPALLDRVRGLGEDYARGRLSTRSAPA